MKSKLENVQIPNVTMLALFHQKLVPRNFNVKNVNLNGKTNPYKRFEKSVRTCLGFMRSQKENI